MSEWYSPGRQAPPRRAAPPVETRLWVLVLKGASATASTRPHPLGVELVVRVRSELLFSRVIRPGDGTTIEAESADARQGFEARGWMPVE